MNTSVLACTDRRPACGLDPDLAALLARSGLVPEHVEEVARRVVGEETGTGVDRATAILVPESAVLVGDFTARQDGVVAGLRVVEAVLSVACAEGFTVRRRAEEGARVEAGQVLLSVTAPARALLTAGNGALNLLCRLSGIATATRRWADVLDGTRARVRDTRKTTAGLRALEKYAVRCGGGVNHRMSLSDAALVKDNHVVAAGGVAQAFRAVRRRFPELAIEVEVDTLPQVHEVLDAGADLILLDNFTPAATAEAVAVVAGRALLESSGRLTLDTARAYAETGVDYLSVGSLTHSAPALDIALRLRD
ncbi:carboxylating nicotinate-nucleotide diphosphorylase [Streptomyces sp. NPDC001606]